MSPRNLWLVAYALLASDAWADGEWSGRYVGLFGGYVDANDAWGSGPAAISPEGLIFGGLAGYTTDLDGLILGAEADFSVPAMSDSGDCTASSFECELDVQLLSSLRGRAGLALGRVQLYGTAGLSLGFLQADSSLGSSDTKALAGWTAGAGLEWQSTGGLRLGVEYRHSDYGESGVTFNGLGDGAIKLETDDVRLRLSIPID